MSPPPSRPASKTSPLVRRLFDAVPVGHHGLPALLRVLEVVESREVPTAAIECVRRPRLLLNPDFVEAHAATSERLLVLVLHELHHLLLGHARLYPRVTPVENLAFDAVINAILCRLHPEPESLALFCELYDERRFPECFLRPPSEWLEVPTRDPQRRPRVVPPALRRATAELPDAEALGELHVELWSGGGATHSELTAALSRHADAIDLARLPLLGDHRDEASGASSAGDLERRCPALLRGVRTIVERWPQPDDPLVGRSLRDVLDRLAVQPRPANGRRLLALLRAIGSRTSGRGASELTLAEAEVHSPVPRPDRRRVVLSSLGRPPLLSRHELPWRRTSPSGERVHVYLDVSGSVRELVPALCGALLAARERVHPCVHLFSTEVVDVSLGELRRGELRSTFGTSIDCVAEHAERHGVRRAVLVTDGFTGRPGGRHRRFLERVRLGVALLAGSSTRGDLEGVADLWTELEPMPGGPARAAGADR